MSARTAVSQTRETRTTMMLRDNPNIRRSIAVANTLTRFTCSASRANSILNGQQSLGLAGVNDDTTSHAIDPTGRKSDLSADSYSSCRGEQQLISTRNTDCPPSTAPSSWRSVGVQHGSPRGVPGFQQELPLHIGLGISLLALQFRNVDA